MSIGNFRSERDLVAKFLLRKLDDAAKNLGFEDVIDIHMEPHNKIGIPDLTAEKGGRGLYVIEAKFKKKFKNIERDIEPRDPAVIKQARDYAIDNGYPWYATANEKRLILFKIIPGKKPEESIIDSFEFLKRPSWNDDFLKYVLEILPAKLKPLDETLVETLTEAFQDLYPEFSKSLIRKIDKDKEFKEFFDTWLENQGVEYNDETIKVISSQITYLQINKLLFYKVIRIIYPNKLPKLEIKEEEDVSNTLQKYYDEILKIDYQPIYQPDLISNIQHTKRSKERIRTLIDTLNDFDFSSMESDFLGSVYEKLIPITERKRLGQYYTPTSIADLIISLTLENKQNNILDPSCGSGTFLIRLYQKLKILYYEEKKINRDKEDFIHRQILEQLYGIDINQFPAHLSVINLSIQNTKAIIDKVNVIVNDFFNIKPMQATLFGFRSMDIEGQERQVYVLPSFDIIVANPPYIRQEILGETEKKKIKDIIEKEHKELIIGSGKLKNKIYLDKQSDIYIYFFIHSLSMLKDNGKLGFIASNKWLEVSYGEPFQKFLLKSTKINYIIEFDRAIFPDVDINTAIVILQKKPKNLTLKDHYTKFIRFKKKVDSESMFQIIKKSQKDNDNDKYRIRIINQGNLKPGKWNIYLRAPDVFKILIKNVKLTPMKNLGKIYFAIKTGLNKFFILNKQLVSYWNIEEKYIKPCISSPKKIDGLVLNNTKEYLLMVKFSKDTLKGTNVLKYLEYGEKIEIEVKRGAKRGKKLIPQLKSISGHRPYWYSLPDLDIPDILIPKFTHKKIS